MRMSKLRLAEYHFRKASEIHPRNAVLMGCVGMVSQVECVCDRTDWNQLIVRSMNGPMTHSLH